MSLALTGTAHAQLALADRFRPEISYAVEAGRIEVIRYLLDHGARVDVADDMGRTPIEVAGGTGGGRGATRSPEIVALLKAGSTSR